MKDQFSGGKVVVDNALGFWVHRVYQASRNEMFREFKKVGEDITPEQWAVLIRLWESDGQKQSDLSDATFRDRPTMSRIVDGMESRGWIVRREGHDDGRVRTIHLTTKGRDLEALLVPVVQRIVERMVKGVPQRDLETTRNTLRALFDNLVSLAHVRPPAWAIFSHANSCIDTHLPWRNPWPSLDLRRSTRIQPPKRHVRSSRAR